MKPGPQCCENWAEESSSCLSPSRYLQWGLLSRCMACYLHLYNHAPIIRYLVTVTFQSVVLGGHTTTVEHTAEASVELNLFFVCLIPVVLQRSICYDATTLVHRLSAD